jgi:hypothetical protein
MEDGRKDTRKQFINNEFLALVQSSKSAGITATYATPSPLRPSETNCYFEKNRRHNIHTWRKRL